jgi:DNA-binding NarL/FixJ family response regulator
VSVASVFAVHAQASTHLIVSRAVGELPRTELSGSSRSAIEAARLIDMLSPGVVTLDARLPDGDGTELAERLHADYPGLGIILFGPSRASLLRRAVAAGISAYVVAATADVARVAAAIRSCLAGHNSFSSRLLARAVRNGRPMALSRREREVTELIRYGLGPTGIAKFLQISESSVKTYVARARAKADVDSPLPRRFDDRQRAGVPTAS